MVLLWGREGVMLARMNEMNEWKSKLCSMFDLTYVYLWMV